MPQAAAGSMFTNERLAGNHAGSQAVEFSLLLLFKIVFAQEAEAGQMKWLQL